MNIKSYSKVCKSLIKRNKILSFGLLIMSILTIVVGVLGLNISESAKESIINYIDASNLPDKVYYTNVLSTSQIDNLLSIDGVKAVNYRYVIPSNFEIEKDGVFSGNVITYDENGLNKITIIEETDVPNDVIKSYLPTGFANRHNVKAGEDLIVFVNGNEVKTVIKAIISSPETLSGEKDFMSVHEVYSYCNFYVDYGGLDGVLDFGDTANQWLFYFDENLAEQKKDQIMLSIENVFKEENIISINDFEGSRSSLLSFKSNLNRVKDLGNYFAILIVLISLGFNVVFIQIIIKKEKCTIALLKALGYKNKNVVSLFCLFAFLINIPAMLLGFPLGLLVLRITLFNMESNFFMPLDVLSVSSISIVCLVLATVLVGLLSCIFVSRHISKIEPSDLYSKHDEFWREPVKFFKHFKGNNFTKISLASMARNISRQIVGSLCIAACVLFMFVSLEGYASNNKVRAGGYGDRFTYDFVIRSIDDNNYQKIKENIDLIDIIEPYIFIDGSTSVGSKRIAAMKEDNVLTTLFDKDNNILKPGDGILIDQFTANKNNLKIGDSILIFDVEVKITGIAIEYLNAVSYISFDTAERLGITGINGAMVKLKEGASMSEFSKGINEIDSDIYVVKMADQRTYLYESYTSIAVALLFLGTLSFLIGAILIINTAIMDFLELKTKYATLRTIGTPMKKIIKISFIENLIRCLIGCIIALPLCYLSAKLLFNLLSSNVIYYTMTKFFVYYALSATICIIYIVISVLITYFAIKKLNFAHHLNSRE